MYGQMYTEDVLVVFPREMRENSTKKRQRQTTNLSGTRLTRHSIQTWALEEARRRLEAEGILADPDVKKD